MKTFILRTCLVLTLLLAGCAVTPPIAAQKPEDVAARCTVTRDDFKKVIYVDAEQVNSPINWSGGVNDYIFWLEASRNDGYATIYKIVFKTTRGDAYGWAFWQEAFDSNGKSLPVAQIGREVGDGGITYELIAIGLPDDYIKQHEDGITIRVDGQRAQQIISLPDNYIAGFLSKVASVGL